MHPNGEMMMKKKLLVVLIVLAILAAVIVGWLLYVRSTVLGVALADAGLRRSQVHDVDIDYEHGVYEVEFETWEREYHYVIDAGTKEILGSGY